MLRREGCAQFSLARRHAADRDQHRANETASVSCDFEEKTDIENWRLETDGYSEIRSKSDGLPINWLARHSGPRRGRAHHALRVDRRELRPDSRIRGHHGDRSNRIARRLGFDARDEAEGLTIWATVTSPGARFFGAHRISSRYPTKASRARGERVAGVS